MYHYILYISIYIYSHIPLYIIVIHDISLLIYHIALYICIIFVCIYIYQRPHVIDGYTVHSHLVSSFMDNYYLQICPNVDACSPGIFIPKKLCYFLIMFINFLCNMVSLWLFKKKYVVGYGYVPFIYIKNMQKPKDSTTHPIQG